MQPLVSVVIPVHNCLPYLEEALASVFHQTLDREQVEVVAVDDGSTDGSSETLAAWAGRWPQLIVVTQEASGGAGAPRNVGISRARGEFVFFLDGDDFLGPEALERLVAMAHRNGSDVVLARLVGLHRKVPTTIFREDLEVAALTSGVYHTLTPFKLVRRSLIVDHEIRFPEHMRISEDQDFVSRCYLAAGVISVLASYDCYYVVRRADGSNTSFEGLDYATIVQQADETVAMVLTSGTSEPVRAHLVARHVKFELLRRFNADYLLLPAPEREAMIAVASPYARQWDVPGLLGELTVPERLLLRALQAGDADQATELVRWTRAGAAAASVLSGDRWLLAGPGFDRPDREDDLYAVEPPTPVAVLSTVRATAGGSLTLRGDAFVRGVDSEQVRTVVVLRHRDSGEEVRLPVESVASPHIHALERGWGAAHHEAGFAATLDLARDGLEPGVWLVRVVLTTGPLTRELRLTPPRDLSAVRIRGTARSGVRVRAVLRANRRGFVVVSVRPAATGRRRSG